PTPPLMSTLFPYTTLFRSAGAAKKLPRARLFSARTNLCQSSRRNILRDANFRDWPIDQAGELHTIAGNLEGRMAKAIVDVATHGDRKSTRLNSSHVAISYA